MGLTELNASELKKAFLAGAANLEAKKEWINELNVFPVPDGDTGTNMTMTIMSAAKEVSALQNESMAELCKAISSGSLRGARGNSGVILSQLLRGLTKVLAEYESADTLVLAAGLEKAVETAYKAVMKPKEGTILTVAKGMSNKAMEIASETPEIEEFMKEIYEEGNRVLAKTPQMLPVLKQAGVVDSGGQGLMEIVKGIYDSICGVEVDYSKFISESPSARPSHYVDAENIDTSDIKFGYCTEFIINLEKELDENQEEELKSFLESIGDSIVCVADSEYVKIHVHTNDPGLALQKALTHGSLSRIKIDNMREEHRERLIKNSESLAAEQAALREKNKAMPRKTTRFISVSAGEGLSEIFKGIGVDYIIEGGQTMNPSTEDMLNAISRVNAEDIFILPNNKNIILAAQQAAQMVSDKRIHVIPTKTIPQGICALICFMPEESVEENIRTMNESIEEIKSLQLTYAVRDTSIDGYEIKEGDIMGISDQGIIAVESSVDNALTESLKKLIEEDSELVSIYYGADIQEEEAQKVLGKIEALFPGVEIELHKGDQPVYYYIVSVE